MSDGTTGALLDNGMEVGASVGVSGSTLLDDGTGGGGELGDDKIVMISSSGLAVTLHGLGRSIGGEGLSELSMYSADVNFFFFFGGSSLPAG